MSAKKSEAKVKFVNDCIDGALLHRMRTEVNKAFMRDQLAAHIVFDWAIDAQIDGTTDALARYTHDDIKPDEVIGLLAFVAAMDLCDCQFLQASQVRDNSKRISAYVSLMHKRPTRFYDKRTRKWVRKVTMSEYARIPLDVEYDRVSLYKWANPNIRPDGLKKQDGKPLPFRNAMERNGKPTDTLTLTQFFKTVSRVYRNLHFPYVPEGINTHYEAKLVITRSVK